jgi:hypothetical protein
MKPLNYAAKAMMQLMDYPCPDAPGSRAGMRYIAEKLRQAEVFILGEHGELLDRSKVRPEVPGLIFKPPYPVVALEYSAAKKDWGSSVYTEARSSRRIALAWEWQDDLPPLSKALASQINRPGVVIASVAYFDDQRAWMPVAAAGFMPYDGDYIPAAASSDFLNDMLSEGRVSPKQAAQRSFECEPIPLLPEAIMAMLGEHGPEKAMDFLRADLMDEANAYMDLCTALACKNVSAVRHPASNALNRARAAAGKPKLKDFHLLEVAGGSGLPGSNGGGGSSPRAHLRRGHIRRLDANRVTWVNATIVSGRGGFVDKQYSVGGGR